MVPGSKNLEGTPRRFDKTLVYAAWAAFTVPLLLGFLAFTGVNPNGKSSQRLTEVSFVWAEDATGGKPMSHGAKVLADRGQSVTPPRILRATEGQQVINGGRHDEAAPTLRPDLTTCHPGHDVKQIAHVAVGCYPSDSQDASGAIDLKGRAGPMECARTCKEKVPVSPAGMFALGGPRCYCGLELAALLQRRRLKNTACSTACPADESLACGGEESVTAYLPGPWPPRSLQPYAAEEEQLPDWYTPYHDVPTVSVYLWANERLSAMFRSCRLAMHSRRFNYRVVDLRHQIRTPLQYQDLLVARDPGLKVFIYDGCCTPGWILLRWPANTVLVVAADESARWGFAAKNGKQWWGPHGPGRELPSDENKVIMLPADVKPWFKQYYSQAHVDYFGDEVRFMPLGSREEFPSTLANELVPAPFRRYLVDLVVAPTDSSRRKAFETLRATTDIPQERMYLHLTDHWDANPNNPNNPNSYLNSSEFHEILVNSVFTVCPRGHSVEQFRIYEAIEAGSIPILELADGYTASHVPPEFMDSPMVFVESWDHVVEEINKLAADPLRLLGRQRALMEWYDLFMRKKLLEVESVLLSRVKGAR